MAHLRRTLLLFAACIAASKCAQNIDVVQPIVRVAPTILNKEGYFGYSLVLHQKRVVTGFDQNLQNTYVIVGAPNGTYQNSAEKNTGFVYECPITQNGGCSEIASLSDDSADGPLEDKAGQFMGGALASNGDRFIACGHRYVNYNPDNTNTRNVFGRCFHSSRTLNSFTEFQPCTEFGRRVPSSFGVCQAGMSATVAETSDGTDHIGVGAPGSYLWRGIMIRGTPSGPTIQQTYDLTPENTFGWQGYSITKGLFRSVNVEDFATSVPRLGSYFGAVHIVENNDDLQMISQNLVGEQMGEYYGFSLQALNLAGDRRHELLVSAPMYRDLNIGAETGRVFVYQNIGGTLGQVTKLVGVVAYSRFGHAMASLGDINGDGFDDVAISAPFADNGVVYIYHSSASQVITPTPQQIISPDRLNLVPLTIERIKSFGTSLASGVDVDGNNFNDLAVGSYMDQTVVLLRTRPLARIVSTLSASPSIVNLESGPKTTYNNDGNMYPEFTVTLVVEYTGEGSLNVDVVLTAERARMDQGLQQRLFFTQSNDKPSSYSRPLQVRQGVPITIEVPVLVDVGISDILNGFVINLEVTTTEFVSAATDGNVNPTDLSAFPVVDIVGQNSLQVEILNDCEDPCIADLAVTPNGMVTYLDSNSASLPVLTVGLVTEVVIPLTIKNKGKNAFLAQLSFNIPIQQLTFTGINDSVITCNPGNGNGQEIPYLCDLGNPFMNFSQRSVEFRFRPSDSLTGAEGNIVISFNVTSLNEDDTKLSDNNVGITLEVNTEADIFVDQGITTPDQVDHAPSAPEGRIENVTQLGPNVITTFTVGNRGPSIIPESRLTIHWPLQVVKSNFYFVYPIGWRVIQSTSVSVSCENTYFNPENYDIATTDSSGNTGDPGTTGGRRKRSTGAMRPRRSRRNIRIPRQDMENVPVSIDRTVSCMADNRNSPNNNHTCAAIVCSIRQLGAGDRVQIEISAHTDERHLGGNVDRFTFIPSAEVETVGADHITEGNANDNTASAEFRSVPAMVVITTEETGGGDDKSFPTIGIVLIIIAIVVAVVLIIIVGVVLYFCGFFRRKNKTEIEDQARENLADAADGGTAM